MLLCMTADELKQRLAAVRSQGFRRYPRELREEAVRYVRQAHAAGATMMAIGDALGVSDKTVASWLGSASQKKKRAGRLARVTVVPPQSSVQALPGHLVLELGSGMRLMGLDVVSAAALLRLLS